MIHLIPTISLFMFYLSYFSQFYIGSYICFRRNIKRNNINSLNVLSRSKCKTHDKLLKYKIVEIIPFQFNVMREIPYKSKQRSQCGIL